MRALVTGVAGFLGSHLAERLLQEGWEVVGVDDLSAGRRENLEGCLSDPRFRFERWDLRRLAGGPLRAPEVPQGLAEALAGCDVLFHLAATVGVKHYVENPAAVIENNVLVTSALLDLALASPKRPRFVLASTSEVYGKSPALPLREAGDSLLGPTAVARWAYAASKLLDEHLTLALGRRGLPVTVLRFFNAYGPRARAGAYGGVVPTFLSRALANDPIPVVGDGRQTRCFTYVADTAEGILRAALSPAAVGEVFNLGSEVETSILDLAHLVRRVCGSSSPILFVRPEEYYGPGFEEIPRRVPDGSKAARVLGFRPRVGLGEGLRLTLDWFRSQALPHKL